MSVCPDLSLYEREQKFQELCSWYPEKSHEWLADALATWRDFYPQHGPESYPIKSQFTRFMNYTLEKARFMTSVDAESAQTKASSIDAYSALQREYTAQQLDDRLSMLYMNFNTRVEDYRKEHPGISRADAIADAGGVIRLLKAVFDSWGSMTVDKVLTYRYKLSDSDPDDVKERKKGMAGYWVDEGLRIYRNRNRLAMLFLAELKEREGIEAVYNGIELDIDKEVERIDAEKEKKRAERMEKYRLEGLSDEEAEERESGIVKGDRYVDFRTIPFDDTVGIDTRLLFNHVVRRDAEGKVVHDDMGVARRVVFREAIPVLRSIMLDVEPKDMMSALDNACADYPWLGGLVTWLKNNPDDRTLIYKDCKTVQQNYITVGTQHNGSTMHDSLVNSSASGKALAKRMALNITSGTAPEREMSFVDDTGRIRVNHKTVSGVRRTFVGLRDEEDTPGVDKFSYKNVKAIVHMQRLITDIRNVVEKFDTNYEGSDDWGEAVYERTVFGYTRKVLNIPSGMWHDGSVGGRVGLKSVLGNMTDELELFARICKGIGLEVSADDLKNAAIVPINQKSKRYYEYANNRLVVVLDQISRILGKAYSLTEAYPLDPIGDEYSRIEGRRLVSDIDDEMAMLDRALNVTQYDNVQSDGVIGNKRYSTYVPVNLLHETFDRIARILRNGKIKGGKYTDDDIKYLRQFVDRYKQCEGFTVNGEPIGFIKYLDNIVKIEDLNKESLQLALAGKDNHDIDVSIRKILQEQEKFASNDRDPFKIWDNLAYNEVEYADMTDAQHQTLNLRRLINQNAVEIPIQADYEVSEYLQSPLPVGHENWVDAFTDEVLAEAERIARLMKFNESIKGEDGKEDDSKRVQKVYENQGLNFYVFPEMNDPKFLGELSKYSDDSVKLREALRKKVDELLAEYYVKGMKRLVGDDNFILGNDNLEDSIKAKLPATYFCSEDGYYTRPLLGADGKPVLDGEGNEMQVEDKSSIIFKDEKGNWKCYRQFEIGEGGEREDVTWSLILGTMYSQIQIEKMTMGGRAFFPSILEKEKRAMMNHGPRESMYTEATFNGKALTKSNGKELTEDEKTYEKVLYVKDENTGSVIYDFIREQMIEQGMSESEADAYIEGIKATDGIGLRSPEAYRLIKIWNHEWTTEDEVAFMRMMKGTATSKDMKRFWPHFKPLYSGREVVTYPDGTKVLVPVLHKYSEMMILPSSMAGKGGFQMNASPLQGIAKAMEDNGIDLVLFGSGVKVGASYMIDDLFDVVTEKDGRKHRKYETADAISNRITQAVRDEPRSMHKLPWAQFGKTASLPPHILNSMISWSSQAYKLARANISARDIISIGDIEMNARTGQKLFDQVESSIIAFEYEKLMNELEDPSRVIELLQSELAQKSYSSPEMAFALTQLKDGKMALPAFWLTVSNSAQQLITSIFRSRLTRHKTKGANYVQTSSLGLDEVPVQFGDDVRKLRVVTNKDEIEAGKEKKRRIKYIEAYAALHDDRLLEFADENGFLGPDRIQYLIDNGILDPKVLECIGYRTPSDAEHSVIPIRIIGFIVNASGADIILPREVMNMTGHDYDGDKLRVHFRDFEIGWDEDKIRKDYDRRVAEHDESIMTPKGVKSYDAFRKMVMGMDRNNPERAKFRKTTVYSLDYASLVTGDEISMHPANVKFGSYDERIKTYDNAMVDLIFSQLTSPEGSARMLIPGGAGDSNKYAKIFEIIRLSRAEGDAGKAVRKGLAEAFSEKMGRRYVESDMQSTIIYKFLKSIPAEEVQALLYAFSVAESHYSYNHVMDAFNYMMKGANMVSGFALYNSAFALLQKMDVRFVPRKFKYKRKDGSVAKEGAYDVTIMGNRIDKLFDPKTDDRSMYAILTLAHMLNAAVDNGKDPIMGFLGQSNSLIPLDFFLAAAGFNEEQIHLIINQPVVQELKRIMDEDRVGLGQAIRVVFEEFNESRKIHAKTEEEKAENEESSDDENESGQTSSDNSDDYEDDGDPYDEYMNATDEDNEQKVSRNRKNRKSGLSYDKRLERLALYSEENFSDMLGIPFEKILNPSMNAGAREVQENILAGLAQISGAVKELSEAVRVMRPESSTGSVGPDIANTQAKLGKFDDVADKQFRRISGLKEVFTPLGVQRGDSAETIIEKLGDSPEPVTTLLYELSMRKCLSFMSSYFPQANEQWYKYALELGSEYDYAEVKDSLIKSIQNDMLLFKMMSSPKYAGTSSEELEAKRKDLVLEFPYRFNDFRKKCIDNAVAKGKGDEFDKRYADLSENLVVRKITLQTPYANARNTQRPWLTYDAEGLIDTNVTENTMRAWDELLNSDAPEAKKIATDLLNYSIFTNGYSFGRKEFGHFAPFSVLMSTPHFVEALSNILGSTFTEQEWERFKLYFYLNHADSSEKLVPQIPVKMLPKSIRTAFRDWYKEQTGISKNFGSSSAGQYNESYIRRKRVIGIKAEKSVFYFEVIKNENGFFIKPVELCGDTNGGGRRHRQYNPYVDAYSAPALHESDRDKYKKNDGDDGEAKEGEPKKVKSIEEQLRDRISALATGGFQAIAATADEANKAVASRTSESDKLEQHFAESPSSNYADRTKENAVWSDITVAFAVDFTTAGERLTKRVAGDKWMPVQLSNESGYFGAHDEDQYDAILEKMLDKPVKLNIAGNGMQTLSKVTDQDTIDNEVYNYIKSLVDDGAKISEIRSGGQTGVDEAGIKAAIRLGIPWTVVAPNGYKMRDNEGNDLTGKKAFIDRFRNIEPDSNVNTERYKWAKSSDNNYEVSTDGDSRFSALNARLSDGRTIEEAYQLDVKGYRSLGYTWKQAKADRGAHAPVKMTQEQLYDEYLKLWRQWADENPLLIQELRERADGKVLTDKFAGDNPNSVSQARALAQILNETDVLPDFSDTTEQTSVQDAIADGVVIPKGVIMPQQNALNNSALNAIMGKKMFALAERVLDESGNETVVVNGVSATPNNIRELRRQRMYVNLNRRLRELMAKAGVSAGVIDEMYERMGVAGVTDFDKPIALANGMIEYIRLTKGYAGELALPEEFSHLAIAMLRGNNLVERLRNTLANDKNALRSAFGDQYAAYANDPEYRGNRDKLIEEAMGKLVQRQIVEQAEAEYHPIRNLLRRVADAIKNFFNRMFSIHEIQDAVYDSMEISSKLARDLVSGRLIDEMDIANIRTSGMFKSISKDLSERTDILGKVIKNEVKRLDIYMKRLGNDDKAISESPAIAAIRETISNLNDQIWQDKTELALMGYMNDAIARLSAANTELIDAVNSGLGANEEGKQLNLIRDLIFSYSKISKAIRDAIKDGEIIASDEFVSLIDNLDGKISNYYSQYLNLSKTVLMKMLVNVYGEEGVTVTLRGKTRHISIEEMATHLDHDVNFAQQWFYSIANVDDYVLKAIDDVTRKAKYRARNKTSDAQRKIEVAMADYVRETGTRDLSFLYKLDDDGHKTGKYISKEEVNALPEPQRKIAKILLKMKYDADKLVPESYVTAYGGTSSIVMMRKSTMDKVKTSGGVAAAGGVLWDSFKNSILETADDFDPETEIKTVDFEGNLVDKLPVHFLTKSKSESFDDMTDDAATAILTYVGMANEYDELNNVIGLLENARYASMERNVDQGSRRRKQREIIEADDMGYRQLFTVKQVNTRTQEMLDDYYKMHLYGHLHHDEGTWHVFGQEVSKSKVASKVNAVTSISQMAFNFQQRISNIATGKMQIIIEAGNGKFSIGDIAKADALYLKYTPDRLLDTGKTESDNKLSLWREKFDIGQNNGDVRSKNYGKKRVGRTFNTNIAFAGLLAGEDYMSSVTALALAQNFKLKDSDNNEYNLFDAYDVVYTDPVNKTGAYLKLKDGLTKLDGTPLTEDDEYRFMKQAAGTNFDLQGIYNLDDRCAAQSRALGSLAIMYRKWIAPAIKRRYGGAQYDILREDYTEGYYRTLWNNLHPEAIMNLFKEGEAFRIGMLLNWDNLTAMEKNNVKKAFIEMSSIAGILIALMLLDKFEIPDKDDNRFLTWAEKMTYYQLLRLKNELGSMAPTPMLLAEAKKILESPFAAYKPLAATFDAWNLFVPSNYMTTVRSGPYKGHTKAYKYFWSLPILSMRKQFRNLADPTNLINFYKNPQ